MVVCMHHHTACVFCVVYDDPYQYEEGSSDEPYKIVDPWWIKDLQLRHSDRESIMKGCELTDMVINAAQTLMSRQFPHLAGFQNTLLGQGLMFKSVSRGIKSVQILHTGTYV